MWSEDRFSPDWPFQRQIHNKSGPLQGEQLPEKLVVPRLRVHRDWFKGLAEDFIDHSHPDVGAAPDAESQVNRLH